MPGYLLPVLTRLRRVAIRRRVKRGLDGQGTVAVGHAGGGRNPATGAGSSTALRPWRVRRAASRAALMRSSPRPAIPVRCAAGERSIIMANDHDGQLARMHQAASALPDTTREIFRLHAIEALDYPAIAIRLGITTGEVERHLADAILHLMLTLGPADDQTG